MDKQYYKSIEEYKVKNGIKSSILESSSNGLGIEPETVETEPTNRRDFLKLFGFAIASAAVLNSCEQPVRKAIPYLIKPAEVTPGVANYYASTYFDGNDYCSILLKVRDGRPIKIEGNTLSSVTKGGTNARIQASVLSLYDTSRFQKPMISRQEASWKQVDDEITERLTSIRANNSTIVLLTPTINSPSTLAVIDGFKKVYPSLKHVQYDAVSASAIHEANSATFGKNVIPTYHFDKARLIVGFEADFLGSWLMPIEFTKLYSQGRKLENGSTEMSRHIHLEAGLTLTGSNADKRIVVKNSQQKVVLANLYNEIAKSAGQNTISTETSPTDVKKLAENLLANRGKSLVVCGSNDVESQMIVNGINFMLGNIGNTIDLDTPLNVKKGTDKEMATLTKDLNDGKIGGLIIYGVNPVYDYHNSAEFLSGLKKVDLSVSIPCLKDETAEECKYLCPDHYALEAWNDYEIKPGYYSLAQPGIRPLFDTRAFQESLLKWAGFEIDYLDFIKKNWEDRIYFNSGFNGSFYNFWVKSLQDGVFENPSRSKSNVAYSAPQIAGVKSEGSDGIELDLYQNISVGDGRQANNPWLQELPDPVSKVTWDNYASISLRLAEELGLEEGNIIKIDNKIVLPVLIQPGQEYKTISIALGYGRGKAGAVADGIGDNGFRLVHYNGNTRMYSKSGVQIEKVEGVHEFAKTQTHHSMEGRAIIRETTLEEYIGNPAAGNEMHEEVEKHHTSLYKSREFKGHHWGMAVDLNACTGCSACVVACSAENNVPVVGKQQVKMAREMHWIRIDRYYSGDEENPEVVRQPVMCQHCDNAPCENVCPVGATMSSHEGINQMAYNRCIGTRYCNNNCPYKVRRFNFRDYNKADSIPMNTYDPAGMTMDLRRMVLNPDVVVRAKGVIEKCSMCVQRIQEKKLNAKLENRMLEDGEIQPACAQACPANAIVFGDLNDENSKISKFFKNPRNYHLLEEIHTLPSVGYLTKVRNKEV